MEKKIPLINEEYNVLYKAHINDVHFSFKKSKVNLLKSEYYYEGCTTQSKKFIDKCPVCNTTKNLKIVNAPLKPIIDKVPHDEYQIDLWYLPKDITKVISYNYVIDIIDHFSKWIWSYTIINKTAEESLCCLKNYIYSFGKPNKIHSDNETEFKNSLFNDFCSKNNIVQIFSKPNSPNSNGCVEASHKQIKKIVFSKFYTTIGKEFNLEDDLLSAVNYHNNTVHSSTNFKPIYLRDISDEDIIETVKENMKKCIITAIKYK